MAAVGPGRYPRQGRAGQIPDPGIQHLPEGDPLRRSDLFVDRTHPISPGRVQRALQHPDSNRRTACREAPDPGDAHLYKRYELRRTVRQCEDGPGQGRGDGGDGQLHRRRRDVAVGERRLRQVDLPGVAQQVRVQPSPPGAGPGRRDRSWPRRQAGYRRHAHGGKGPR